MTATDELRRLLDERGVEWEDFDGEPTWAGGDGRRHYARQEFTFAGLTDEVTVYHLTPEQAIEATLGRGTCRDLAETPDYRYKTQFECSECGYEYSSVGGFGCDYGDEPDFRYCPNCGRRVVE